MATKWDIEINANKLNQQMAQVQKQIGSMSDKAKEAGFSLKEMFKQTAMFAGVGFGAAGIKEFGNQIIQVRKKMQSLQVSFETLLGSQQKANKMFGELRQFAATTPLMLDSLAQGAQTMLAFNIDAEKVVPTLKQIGDISMGDSEKFKSLTLAFSQMSATGKLMGQDLLQMINAGFNPLTEISKRTGKSISVLKDEMSAGAISVEMVTQAFADATGEGGQFNGMLEKQGETLAGQFNQLQGAIDDMFNTIGEQSEGVISKAVGGVQLLVENYEKVGKVIAALIATYGTYKAAVMVVNAVEAVRLAGLKDATHYMWLNITATKAGTAAQAAFNAVANANPYVLLATVLATVVGVMWAFSDSTSASEKAMKGLNDQREKFKNSLEEEKNMALELLNIIQDQTTTDAEKIMAYDKLKKCSYGLTQQYSLEELKTLNLAKAQKYLNESAQTRNIADLQNEVRKRNSTLKFIQDLETELKREGGPKKNIVRNNDVREMLKRYGYTTLGPAELKKLKDQMNQDLKVLNGELQPIIDANAKTAPTSKIYSTEAENAMKDWKTAKATYEKLKNDRSATLEEVTKARQDVESKDKAYETITGTKASDVDKAAKQRKKQKAEEARQLQEQSIKIQNEQREAGFLEQEAYINTLDNGREKTLAQLRLNYDKERAEIDKERDQKIKDAKDSARALWEADSKNKDKTWDDSMLNNNEAYQNAVDSAFVVADAKRKIATQQYQQGIKDQANAEAEAMRQYLKDYGSYEQQRMAVRLEYQKKINAATTEGEKLALQEGLKKALSDIDLKALQNDLNWGMLFGDLNKYTNSQLKSLRSQLKDYRKSESYKNATVENKKAVDEAMANLENTIQSKSGIFGGLAEAFNNLSDAEIRLKEAEEEIKNAADDREREAATRKRNKAQGDVDEGRANLRKSAEQTRDNVVALANTITSLGSASEMTLSDLGNFVNQFASMFGETGQKIGGWIGAIFSICDMIAKNGIEGFVQNAGKLVGQALGGLFGVDIDKSTHEYQAQKQMHDNYIKLINETLDKQKELLQKQSGMDALGTYSDAKKNYQEIAKYRQQDIANFLNAGGSKGFLGIGSSSSNGVKLRDKLLTDLFPNVFGNLKSNGYAGKLGQIFGMSNDQLMSDKRMTWLADATAEQIEALKKEQDIWAKLPEEVQNYYQEILDAKEATDELAQAFNETIVGTSFDSMVSSFTSALDDMEADAEEFGENFDDIVRKAAVKSLVDTKYRSQLEKFYGDAEKGTGLAGALAKGIENVSQAEIDKLRKDYQGIGDAYQNDLSFIYDKLGLGSNSSVSATNGVAASFSQESIDEANGRMAALQIGQQSQIESLAIVAAAFPGLVTVIGDSNAYLSDIRNLAAMRTSVLNDVYERMGIMQREISGHLAAIVDNTNNL